MLLRLPVREFVDCIALGLIAGVRVEFQHLRRYAKGEDLPIKLLTRCRIVDHDAPGLLVMLAEYFDSIEDEDARKISAIDLALNVDAAEMLGAALIDSAKKRRKEPETKQ